VEDISENVGADGRGVREDEQVRCRLA